MQYKFVAEVAWRKCQIRDSMTPQMPSDWIGGVGLVFKQLILLTTASIEWSRI